MEKLNELINAGVAVSINRFPQYGSKTWGIECSKKNSGTDLTLRAEDEDLLAAIDSVYAKWVLATEKIPSHSLRQIEYKPETSPDETF